MTRIVLGDQSLYSIIISHKCVYFRPVSPGRVPPTVTSLSAEFSHPSSPQRHGSTASKAACTIPDKATLANLDILVTAWRVRLGNTVTAATRAVNMAAAAATSAGGSPGKLVKKSKSSNGLQNGDKETAEAQQRINAMFVAKSASAAQKRLRNGDHTRADEDDDDGDSDRGEGTSADRASIMAKLASAGAAGHISIASLLKEPLVFVQAKHADEASQKLPYEPLTAGPVASTPQVSVLCALHCSHLSSLLWCLPVLGLCCRGPSLKPY